MLTKKLGRLGVTCFILLALYVVLRISAPSSGFTTLGSLALYVTGTLYALQLVRRNLRRIIWRLRNRIIVAYLFIAFVPIVLIVVLVVFAGWALVGQSAVYLVYSELDRRTAALKGVARMLAGTPAPRRENAIHQVAPYIQDRFPKIELLIRDKAIIRYPDNSNLSPPPAGWKNAS